MVGVTFVEGTDATGLTPGFTPSCDGVAFGVDVVETGEGTGNGVALTFGFVASCGVARLGATGAEFKDVVVGVGWRTLGCEALLWTSEDGAKSCPVGALTTALFDAGSETILGVERVEEALGTLEELRAEGEVEALDKELGFVGALDPFTSLNCLCNSLKLLLMLSPTFCKVSDVD